MNTLDESSLDALKSKYPGVQLHLAECDEGAIVFRTPPRGEWKRFVSEAAEKARAGEALAALVRSCLVWPDLGTYDALIERLPALSEAFGTKVAEAAGVQESVVVKKL